jgi:Chlorophyll A-B binding protein
MNTDLYWMREAELKHARIAMLAVVGSIAQEAGFVVPGLVSSPLNVPIIVTRDL